MAGKQQARQCTNSAVQRPVQRSDWPESAIDWLHWIMALTYVMLHVRTHKLHFSDPTVHGLCCDYII